MSQVDPSADPSPDRGDAVPHVGDAVPHAGDALQHKVDPVPLEARPFQGQRAGIVTRTAANVVDFLVVVVGIAFGYAAWCAGEFLVNPTGFTFPTLPFLVWLVCFEVVLVAYFTASWATTGRTYGDHLLGLRVVNLRGERLRWLGSLVRAVFCALVPIGLYWAVFSPTNRSVQDAVQRTSVVYDWTARSQASPRITRSG